MGTSSEVSLGIQCFGLIDKVHHAENLFGAYVEVAENEGAAGVDHVTIQAFGERLDENLKHLQDQLRTDRYGAQKVRRAWITKLGSREKRPLGIRTLRDAVVALTIIAGPTPSLQPTGCSAW